MAILSVDVALQVHEGLKLDIRFDLEREAAVIFGASGAGKTTLLRMIAGLVAPDSGRITIAGDVLLDSERRIKTPLRDRGIGLIFQDDLLFPHLSVRENIAFGLSRLGAGERARRTSLIAELCGVGGLLERIPKSLSGGERQRVGLARALAPRPRLLLCDEPVSALDLQARFSLIETLREIQASEGLPLLCVTHSPAEAIALGSRLLLLELGAIADQGPPLEVLGRASARGTTPLEDLQNVFAGSIVESADRGDTSAIAIAGGPVLMIPKIDRPPNAKVCVRVRADDILLAVGPAAGLSARNILPGVVERVIESRSGSAEVVVATGQTRWVVSATADAARALELAPGRPVNLVIKARSCHVE